MSVFPHNSWKEEVTEAIIQYAGGITERSYACPVDLVIHFCKSKKHEMPMQSLSMRVLLSNNLNEQEQNVEVVYEDLDFHGFQILIIFHETWNCYEVIVMQPDGRVEAPRIYLDAKRLQRKLQKVYQMGFLQGPVNKLFNSYDDHSLEQRMLSWLVVDFVLARLIVQYKEDQSLAAQLEAIVGDKVIFPEESARWSLRLFKSMKVAAVAPCLLSRNIIPGSMVDGGRIDVVMLPPQQLQPFDAICHRLSTSLITKQTLSSGTLKAMATAVQALQESVGLNSARTDSSSGKNGICPRRRWREAIHRVMRHTELQKIKHRLAWQRRLSLHHSGSVRFDVPMLHAKQPSSSASTVLRLSLDSTQTCTSCPIISPWYCTEKSTTTTGLFSP